MNTLLAAVVVAAAALATSASLSALAGLGSRPPLRSRDAARGPDPWRDGLRLSCALAAVFLLVGSSGDLVVAAALTAVAAAPRCPPVALAVLLAGAAGAARVGSTAMGHVAAAHAVLGPALSSPVGGVAVGGALVVASGMAAAVALLPARPRGGLVGVISSPGVAADALAPVAAALTALVVAAGPLVEAGVGNPVVWTAVRGGALAGGVVAAALARRVVPESRVVVVGSVAAALAAAGFATVVAA